MRALQQKVDDHKLQSLSPIPITEMSNALSGSKKDS